MSKLSRFAGLFGGLTAKRAEDDKEDKPQASEKPTQNEGESDEDFQERLKKWEDENKDESGKKKGEGPKDTSEDDQDKKDKDVSAARAAGVAEGAEAEGVRWASVLSNKAAIGRVAAACNLLVDTDMTADAVVKTLATLPAETGVRTLASRQPEATPAPAVTGDHDDATKGEGPKGFAARMAATMNKVRPEKKS